MPNVNNEKVSNLTSISANELSAEDLFFIGDISAKESKKLSTGELLTYFNISASVNALHSNTANTSSWSYNVINIPPTSSFSSLSNTASYALQSQNSLTASYALSVPSSSAVNTASYLLYSGANNGTASYSIISNVAISSYTASFLQYIPGSNNGTITNAQTSSISISSSYSSISLLAITSSLSFSSSYSETSSISETASYINPLLVYTNNPIKAWAWVTWSLGVTQPKIIENYNIDEIKYLNRFYSNSTISEYPVTWSQFAVKFSTPLQFRSYMLMGDGYQPFGDPERAGVVLHPYYDSRSLNGFTMSVVTQGPNDFYIRNTGTYPNSEYGFITFQIIGY